MKDITTPVVSKDVVVPFILITSLFALWGFANDITNPMVAAFGTVMEISTAKAALVQLAFYGGYATMAIPAALFVRRYSYKKGILFGLVKRSETSKRVSYSPNCNHFNTIHCCQMCVSRIHRNHTV